MQNGSAQSQTCPVFTVELIENAKLIEELLQYLKAKFKHMKSHPELSTEVVMRYIECVTYIV